MLRALVMCAAAVAAAALPRPDSVSLSELAAPAVNASAVCPFVVEIDVDRNRVPMRLKQVKCAPAPNALCQRLQVGGRACCQHESARYELACREAWDVALVLQRSTRRRLHVPVAVGCVCVLSAARAQPSRPLPDGPA